MPCSKMLTGWAEPHHHLEDHHRVVQAGGGLVVLCVRREWAGAILGQSCGSSGSWLFPIVGGVRVGESE